MEHQPLPGVQVVKDGSAPQSVTRVVTGVTPRQRSHPGTLPRCTSDRNIYGLSIVTLGLAIAIVIFDAASIGLANTIHESKRPTTPDTFKNWAARRIDYRQRRIVENEYSYTEFYSPTLSDAFIGSGIWGGIFTIISASFGIAAGRSHKNRCMINTHTVLSIFTAILSICMIMAPAVAIIDIDRCDTQTYFEDSFAYVCDDDRWRIVRALQVTVLGCGLSIGIFSLITSPYSCQGACSCGGVVVSRTYGAQHYLVVQQHGQTAPLGGSAINPMTNGRDKPPPTASVHYDHRNQGNMPQGQPWYPASHAPYGCQPTAAPPMDEKPPAYKAF